MNEHNPYSPPVTIEAPTATSALPPNRQAMLTRRRHLRRESGIRGLAWLLLVVGGITTLCAIAIGIRYASSPSFLAAAMLVVAGFYLVLGIYQFLTGFFLRRLHRAGRILYTVGFGIASLIVLLSTVQFVILSLSHKPGANPLGVFFLWLSEALALGFLLMLWHREAHPIFAPTYRTEIIPATPRAQPTMPWWFWVLSILYALVTVLGTFGIIVMG